MEKEKVIRYVKISITCFVLVLFIWFFFLSPFIAFKKNEKTMLNAARRYFEVNSNELPTGDRIKTLDLTTLYHRSFLKEDLKLPYSSKMCDLDEGWVKVRKEKNEYKYYVYLKCGALSSKVDHEGPEINLNGEDTITINRGDKYKEFGIKSVVDDTDGNMKISGVEIDSSKVDTNTIGKYKVTYTIKDSFNNKTVKTRIVNVVSVLKSVVNKDTNNTGIYTGMNVNNYIEFSGMLFRIVGLDSNKNVKIVANEDVSFIDYKSLDKWLDYYYEHLKDSSKEYIVKSKYCNDVVNDDNINNTKCSSYTDKKNLYILSINDYNKSIDNPSVTNSSYLYPNIISLVANKKNDKEVYTTRSFFIGTSSKYMAFDIDYNFGVRPVITIKGNIKLKAGNGTLNDPYTFENKDTAKAGDNLNSRYTGEYITYSGYTWRIIESNDDGTTKVILEGTLGNDISTGYTTDDKSKIYNPKQKGNVGYFINNKALEYINTNYFVSKNVAVPIYDDISSYSGKKTTKKYKVKLSAPNVYDLFSTMGNGNYYNSYWLRNSSKREYVKYIVSSNGNLYYTEQGDSIVAGIKLVGYLDKNCTIKSGNGTLDKPYQITK